MAVTPVGLRANYSDLFGSAQLPVLELLFRTTYDQYPMLYPMLFGVESTDRDIWQSSTLHDLPQFNQIAEGEEYEFVRSRQGGNKTFTMTKYGLGCSISEEMVADGKFNHISMLIEELGRSAAESRAIKTMNIFNNGFSSVTTSDGVALFSTAHTLPSGLTFRNAPSSAADLSVTSLETALTDFETQFISDSGKYLMIKPKYLLVHSSEYRNAKELVGSELKPNNVASGGDLSSTNRYNSFKEEGLTVLSSPHLSDSDAWFLVSEPARNGLKVVEREPVQSKAAAPDSVGFSTDAILYKSRYRWEVGAVEPYGVYGNAGA